MNEEKVLNKGDILWIFAVKDNNIKEHYNRYYGSYQGYEPTEELTGSILSKILDKIPGAWKRAMDLGRMDKTMHVFMKGHSDFTWEEWQWNLCYKYISHMTRSDWNELAPVEWEQWVDEERASYKVSYVDTDVVKPYIKADIEGVKKFMNSLYGADAVK